MGRFKWRRHKEGTSVEAAPQPGTVAPEEFRRIVEDRIRGRFGMSLTEFVAAFRSGKLDDDPAAYELAVVSGASSRR